MKFKYIFPFLLFLAISSCIGDDIIDDEIDPFVRINNPIDSIQINTEYLFEATYFNNVGMEVENDLSWKSSDESILQISENGNAIALQLGEVIISVETTTPDGITVMDQLNISVGNSTVVANPERTGSLQTTSSYLLKGDFTLSEIDGVLTLSLANNYEASTALPGLYVYLTNNPNTTSGAYEIGKVLDFSGAHTYSLPSSIGLMDYEYVLYFCKPFNVKVGDGQFDN